MLHLIAARPYARLSWSYASGVSHSLPIYRPAHVRAMVRLARAIAKRPDVRAVTLRTSLGATLFASGAP